MRLFLGQFWAEVIFQSLTQTQNAPLKSYEEDMKQISSGGTNHNNFSLSFAGIEYKLDSKPSTLLTITSYYVSCIVMVSMAMLFSCLSHI